MWQCIMIAPGSANIVQISFSKLEYLKKMTQTARKSEIRHHGTNSDALLSSKTKCG